MTLWDEEWIKDAACSGMDSTIFYPENYRRGDRIIYDLKIEEAKSICNICPVREECLEFALQRHTRQDSYGIWGGYTLTERRRILRQRKHGARRSSQR